MKKHLAARIHISGGTRHIQNNKHITLELITLFFKLLFIRGKQVHSSSDCSNYDNTSLAQNISSRQIPEDKKKGNELYDQFVVVSSESD